MSPIRPSWPGKRARTPLGVRAGLVIMLNLLAGCHTIPFAGKVDATAGVDAAIKGTVDAGIRGTVDVRLPAAVDPGPMLPVVVRPGASNQSPPTRWARTPSPPSGRSSRRPRATRGCEGS
jgi:hypothetical protein